MGKKNQDEQAFFATKQRRLLNQLQQQMTAKETRHNERPGTAQEIIRTETLELDQTPPRTRLRTTMRDSPPKPGKSNDAARKSIGFSSISEPAEASFYEQQIQPKQEDPESPSTDSEDDLKLDAPPPKTTVTSIEGLSVQLFSDNYLQYIIQDSVLYERFGQFLSQFHPQLIPILLHHIEIQKATKALEYANAVAGTLGPFPGDSDSQGIQTAAAMNKDLDERRQRVADILMSEALPAQINFGLIDVVTNAMQNAIRGTQQSRIMRNLIGGLTEVFTLTDPSIPDNPIIYASEEFYNMTGYGRDFVIGRNCRFLQGPKTSHHSVRRLKTSIDGGVEISETLLNYRRDGTPFMNLLLVAPLHDNKGRIKYYIGAQVDVTGLVEEGQGLEGFDAYLTSRKKKQDALKRHGARDSLALQKLAELSEMFDVSENAIVRSHSRSNSLTRDSAYGSPQKSMLQNRRIIIEENPSDDDDDDTRSQATETLENEKWKLAGPSAPTGILPGVYQKYMLLRPAPSLKVIFVSPALRKLSKLSKKGFLDCIDCSRGTMEALKEAFGKGMPVSAKVSWKYDDSKSLANGERKDASRPKRDTWISGTPMLGSDDSIGVWMVVVVQNPNQTKATIDENTQKLAMSRQQSKERLLEDAASGFAIDASNTTERENKANMNGSPKRYSTASTFSDQQPRPQTPTRARSPSMSSRSATPRPMIPNRSSSIKKNRDSGSTFGPTFSQSIPDAPPTSSSSTIGENGHVGPSTPEYSKPSNANILNEEVQDLDSVYPQSRRELPALQDEDGIQARNSEKKREKVGNGTKRRVRIRPQQDSDDEDGGKGEDDSGVDTVDEDGNLASPPPDIALAEAGRETPEMGEGRNPNGVVERWSPPSKNFWVKPPRPTMPGRMLSVD